ncbi:MAG TPA: carboxypeptidase regulatory-like domain-containing protein [Polyangiaceae bacterium]
MENTSTHDGGHSRFMSWNLRGPLLTLLVWLSWLVGCSGEQPSGVQQGLDGTRFEPTSAPGALQAQRPMPAAVAGNKRVVWVELKQSASLTTASRTRGWRARGQSVYSELTRTAASSQASLRRFLEQKGVKYKAHWIVNAVRVEADEATIAELEQRSDVARVLDDQRYEIPQPTPGNGQASVNSVEWNIDNIRASEAWDAFGTRGEGIVVANIDTGVQFDHPALVNQYRGSVGDGSFDHNYSWNDPSSVCAFPSTEPCDNNGHGTHTMGTMVGDDGGDNQIGVAPGAKWIAAKGCEDFFCSTEALIAAGEWILAPTDLNGENPRPDLRPHIVNNSWSGGAGDEFYRSVVQAWVAAGIFPAFAIGNDGYYGCSTSNSPGDYPESYAAGAYDINEEIAAFSSKGPSFLGFTKPNIGAPGVDVRSSVPGGYDFFNGTSMASPHVAGSVALLWSAAVALEGDVENTRALLDSTAVDHDDLQCGGEPENNNTFGEGKLDVYAALDEAPIGPTGTLVGSVIDSEGNAIVGASILASGPFDRATSSDDAGAFSIRLPVGEYQVSASSFGYLPATESITVEEGATIELTFSLESAPSFALEGTLSDTEGAAIGGALVSVLDTPLPTLTTDDSGFFQFPSVPVGEYTLRVSSGGCHVDIEVPVVVSDADQSLSLTAEFKTDAYGYQCHEVAFDYIEGDTPLDFYYYYDDQTLVELPFPFTLYGETYESLWVTTNGYMAFDSNFPSSFNTIIPDSYSPNGALYGLWDDLSGGGSVLTATVGTAPNRRFVVEWRDFGFYYDSGDNASFEIVLNETGEIVMQYATADGNSSQGASATIGIENAAGDDALQYSYNRASVSSETAVLYEVPFSGFVQGVITDANDGLPVAGVTVTASNDEGAARSTRTNGNGVYRLQLSQGDYTLDVSKTNYVSATAEVTVVEDTTAISDFSLLTPKGVLTPSTIELVLAQGEMRTRTLTLSNAGSARMDFEVREAGGRLQTVNRIAQPTPGRANAVESYAFTAEDLYSGARPGSAIEPQAAGDIIRSFTPEGLGLAWGIGQAQNLWLSDAYGRQNVEFTDAGDPTGLGHSTPWAADWPADMAFDEARNLMCQLAVGGDNAIHCWDQATGDVVETISGAPWVNISQRGLAYNPNDDTFFVGGWNEGIIYHVAGASYGDDAGSVLSQCQPSDPAISGLAYNSAMDVLWMATNSPDDTIYELNPYDCTVLAALEPPQGGQFQGAGLDLDGEGNLWAVAQYPSEVYLIDSGVPSFGDIPWLTVEPSSGGLNINKKRTLEVTVDTTGLEPGFYLGSIFVVTNSGRQPVLRVPVSLVVSGYLHAINSGGPEYVDRNDDVWEADRKHQKGSYGYVEGGSVETTTHGIGNTQDPILYQTLREDVYAYRFDDVPSGVYQIDLRFAEHAGVPRGDRLFDVIAEDVILLPAHDIVYEVGRYKADDNRFFVEVTDGQLDVRLAASTDRRPVLSAIRVVHRPDR